MSNLNLKCIQFIKHWKLFQTLDEIEWIDNSEYIFQYYLDDSIDFQTSLESFFQIENDETKDSLIKLFKLIHEKFLFNTNKIFHFPIYYIVQILYDVISLNIAINNAIKNDLVEYLLFKCILNPRFWPIGNDDFNNTFSFSQQTIPNIIFFYWSFNLSVILQNNKEALNKFKSYELTSLMKFMVEDSKNNQENEFLFYPFYEFWTFLKNDTDDSNIIISLEDIDRACSICKTDGATYCLRRQIAQFFLSASNLECNRENIFKKRTLIIELFECNSLSISKIIKKLLKNMLTWDFWENTTHTDPLIQQLLNYHSQEKLTFNKKIFKKIIIKIFKEIGKRKKKKFFNFINSSNLNLSLGKYF